MLDADQIAPERIRGLRRSEYDRLVALGVFEDEKVELLCGAIVEMSPQGTRHASVGRRLADLLARALGTRALVSCQFPFAASDDSEPEPDIAVIRRDDYLADHPTRAHFIAEVAETSLRKDRGAKSAVYAAAGVPEYWVVNLADNVIEVFTGPGPDGYARQRLARSGERLQLLEFPDVELAVDEILPR
jgi:Uma2 family endonuclease